jgi:hypothetical protein
MVISFELKWSTSLVAIAFLSKLSNLQVGLDAVDYLHSLSDMVRTKDRPLTRVNLVLRHMTSAAIQCFEKLHLETLLITVIVRELNQ